MLLAILEETVVALDEVRRGQLLHEESLAHDLLPRLLAHVPAQMHPFQSDFFWKAARPGEVTVAEPAQVYVAKPADTELFDHLKVIELHVCQVSCRPRVRTLLSELLRQALSS